MPPLVLALAIAGGLLAGGWILLALLVLSGTRRVRLLHDVLPPHAPPRLPSLSVVVTARDEAAGIQNTVRRLLAQRYPGLEVVVVDDRSTDGTGEILDDLAIEAARGAARLVVVHNTDLPEGWLGKCHACHLGAERSRGEWILFTDGDVSLVGDHLLTRVVAFAEAQRLDHMPVLPDLRPMSPLQAGLVAAFGQLFIVSSRAHEMERDLRRGGTGVGAFNLVRRRAYERIGGHRLLRMELGDDFKLGRLLKESGARQRLYNGLELVRCRWHHGTLKVVRGLEKNFFSGFNFSLGQLCAATLVLLALTFGPAACAIAATAMLLPDAGATPLWPLAAAWAPIALQAAAVLTGYLLGAPLHGYNPWTLTLLHPVSVLLLLVAAWNSAVRTLAQGGVRWRETFYPIAALRAGQVPQGAGRRFGEPLDASHHPAGSKASDRPAGPEESDGPAADRAGRKGGDG